MEPMVEAILFESQLPSAQKIRIGNIQLKRKLIMGLVSTGISSLKLTF
jgi:hypothetical protein